MRRLDLHPYFDPLKAKVQFWVHQGGVRLNLELSRETIEQRYAVPDTYYGLLMAYDSHRDEIDAAVMHRARQGGDGTLLVRASDFAS